MKVLQINSVCGIRSTGRICTDIADVLRMRGDECRIAYGREKVPEKYKEISFVYLRPDGAYESPSTIGRYYVQTGKQKGRRSRRVSFPPTAPHIHK